MTAFHEDLVVGPSTTVSLGSYLSIIRDNLTVSQPPGFEGDIGIIEAELNTLSTINSVTVDAVNAIPDDKGQCSWMITFNLNAGNLPALQVSSSENNNFSTSASLRNGDSVIIYDDVEKGTSEVLSGHFTLSYDGNRTPYLQHNVSARELKTAINNLKSAGYVDVTQEGPGINNEFIWCVTFLSDYQPLHTFEVDSLDLKGTMASVSVSKERVAIPPPFDGPNSGSVLIHDLSMLSVAIWPLKQGIKYTFRVSALNSIGASLVTYSWPRYVEPLPQSPPRPFSINLMPKDGESITMDIDVPKGGVHVPINGYRVDYSLEEFRKERQRVSLECSPMSEVQVVTTHATDINEVQLVVIDSSYEGDEVKEVQRVDCDASGGTLALSFKDQFVYIAYDASSQQIKEALESIESVLSITVSMNSGTTACRPFDGHSAGSFSVTFESIDIQGKLQLLGAETNSLDGARRVEIVTEREGRSPVGGSFVLAFRGSRSEAIYIAEDPNELRSRIEAALVALDTIEEDGVIVEHVALSNGGYEKVFSITFVGTGVGGNVLPLEVPSDSKRITGTDADVIIVADGDEYYARNSIDVETSIMGNVLGGHFKLKLRGHITEEIPFNAASEMVKVRLESLPNVGNVQVKRGMPTKQMEFSWTITFISNLGTFPPSSRNIDNLEPVSNLFTSNHLDDSQDITVSTVINGDNPVSGSFRLAFDDGISIHVTDLLEPYVTEEDMKITFEALPNVGIVEVKRIESNNIISWDIEFDGCSLKDGIDVCNDGDLLPIIIAENNLTDCGNVELFVSKIISGQGPSICSSYESSCSIQLNETKNLDFPITHNIFGLDFGKDYYVRAFFRNEMGLGPSMLSTPTSVKTRYNTPGPPPPVKLVESTSTSITLAWEKPFTNGGTRVSGYELWIDTWNGGDPRMIYDGSDQALVFEYKVSTSDSGVYSQILESGRQYLFKVRALNYCDPVDPGLACRGNFSDPQLYTVREPRSPLAPPAPVRDSRSEIGDISNSSISIFWRPPTDNGGSPITGYFVYVKSPDNSMQSHSVDSLTTQYRAYGLKAGELYRFYIVAKNGVGRSGNSPSLSVVAGILPGLDKSLSHTFATDFFRPIITNVKENSLTLSWKSLPASSIGGTPITGYKVYLFEGVPFNSISNQEPIHQEEQDILLDQDAGEIHGNFTISFRGYRSNDIPVTSSDFELKIALENLPSINVVAVSKIAHGWRITFLSEAGDLPLMEVTSGRLVGPFNPSIKVVESKRGTICTLLNDGPTHPGNNSITANNLSSDSSYAFKVAPINTIGDGILSLASRTTSTRLGASSKFTTASGSSLRQGIAGVINEQQTLFFATPDCDLDKLYLSFDGSNSIRIPCMASAAEFKSALEQIDSVGSIQVSRTKVYTAGGLQGYSWTVTFTSNVGDIPLLEVDLNEANGGRDAHDLSGNMSTFVREFLKGSANEFTIEPKTSSGSVLGDLFTADGFVGSDIFLTELWQSDCDTLDGSHEWYADGSIATFNPIKYEKQVLTVPRGSQPFTLIMDTREGSKGGRLQGLKEVSPLLPGSDINTETLESALRSMSNVGRVDITDNSDIFGKEFVITFQENLGEMPLLTSSNANVTITRNGEGEIGSTEVQSISLSIDRVFVNEIQNISVLRSFDSFELSLNGSPSTSKINVNVSQSDVLNIVSNIKAELEQVSSIKVNVGHEVLGNGKEEDPWIFSVTFLEPVGPVDMLVSNIAEISREVRGESFMEGTFVLSYDDDFTADIPYDATDYKLKNELETLKSIEEVNVYRTAKPNGFTWEISFTKSIGNLNLIQSHMNTFCVQTIELIGGNPTPLGGYFSLNYLNETTYALPFDVSSDEMKVALEMLSSIQRVDVERQNLANGQNKWKVTFRVPVLPTVLALNSDHITGTLTLSTVKVVVDGSDNSLRSLSGRKPSIHVEEKVAGRPSYTGRYIARATGNYCLAVMQLEGGGLGANYFDNQWLSGEPSMEKVDRTLDFDWGEDLITPYGRDYVSIRWWGKIKPLTTEVYTFYVEANEGVKLFVDHHLLVDAWDATLVNEMNTISLLAEKFYDIKVEFRKSVGSARISVEWSSNSIPRTSIPSDQLYHASHISGSPFRTEVVPGAADYPFSDLIDGPGNDRTVAIAGQRSRLYIQAKVR